MLKFFEEIEDLFIFVKEEQIIEINNVNNVTLFFLSKPNFEFIDNSQFVKNVKKTKNHLTISDLNNKKIFFYLDDKSIDFNEVEFQVNIQYSQISIFDDEKTNFHFELNKSKVDFAIYADKIILESKSESLIDGNISAELLNVFTDNESKINLSGTIKNLNLDNNKSEVKMSRVNLINANIINRKDGVVDINIENKLILQSLDNSVIKMGRKPEFLKYHKEDEAKIIIDDYTYTKFYQEECAFDFMSYTMEDFNKFLEKKNATKLAKKEEVDYKLNESYDLEDDKKMQRRL